MRMSIALLLFAVLCVPVLAAVPSCVLKVRITSPTDGYFAPAVSDGYNNLFINARVTNASSGAFAVGAQATLILDNGTQLDMPAFGPGNYSIAVADYREGTHTYIVHANLSGCIDDSITQYYYYRKGVVRSAPDFNPILAPFVALALLAVARMNTAKKGKAKK